MRTTSAILALLMMIFAAAPAGAQGCGTGTDSCLTAHSRPGCKDADCCNTVCMFQPSCCSTTWDASCASTADQNCVGLCGASVNGPCTMTHANPSCSNAECCTAVCNVDPSCCTYSWDTTCLYVAQSVCTSGPPVQCGAAGQGGCYTVHATPGCSDAACCTTVCGIDPSCCTFAWDDICVQFTSQYCGGCNFMCPTDAEEEPEGCLARNNDPCAGGGQAPTALAANIGVCGLLDGANDATGKWAGDRDIYAVTVADTDGDGTAHVTLHLAGKVPVFAVLMPTGCPVSIAGALVKVNAPNCVEATSSACIAPGNYWIMVVPGTFPNPASTEPITCDTNARYSMKLEVSQSGCTPTCGPASGPCFEAHQDPGCSDAACCQATCATDPFCCSSTWDYSCARAAAVACNAPFPANDTCATAQPIAVGQTIQFTSIRAQSEGTDLPSSCDTAGTGRTMGPDVWFSYDGERSGNVVVSTCGSATDFRIAVYSGTCAAQTLVACNSSSILCTPNTGARLQFSSVCGSRYWIRIGGEMPGIAGPGQVTLSASGPICPDHCPSDINRDRRVDGGDLGLLLGNWGGFGLGDLNQDGRVDGADLGKLLGDWGQCP